eukprot:GHVN01011684.1.p2 GENE.GHVN01011684.1~~GHVN01011684.1.p2  ORF type:complete len:146 (-),score=36.12 GHVN01011684.1:550-987(-)
MISDADADGQGVIRYEEFLNMMKIKMAERDPMEEIRKAFRLFDDDGSGRITFKVSEMSLCVCMCVYVCVETEQAGTEVPSSVWRYMRGVCVEIYVRGVCGDICVRCVCVWRYMCEVCVCVCREIFVRCVCVESEESCERIGRGHS